MDKEHDPFFEQSNHLHIRFFSGAVCHTVAYHTNFRLGHHDDNLYHIDPGAYSFRSPFAGVWADRYDRRKLIMLSDSFIAFVILILAILFHLGYDMLWVLIIAAALRSLGRRGSDARCKRFSSADRTKTKS